MTATYLPNPLNQYLTYSYNITIRQVNPRNFSGENTSGGVLIADNSKSSMFNIEYCEQTLVLGHDTVRSSFANRFDIKITEPNSATFLDVIRNAAVTNGIENLTQAIYIIEITFPARDQSNNPTKFPNTFKYAVIFTDVVANIDHGGSYYTITANEVSTTAYSYIQGVNKSTITFTAATVGDAIRELQFQQNLSEQANFLLDPNCATWNEYVFEFDSETGATEWENWQIESVVNEADRRFYNSLPDGHQFILPSGTNLHEYIGVILRSTEEWKRLPTADGGYALPEGGEPSQAGSETKLKVFYKVVTEVEYGEYDVLRNDYQKTIKYKIKKHIVGDVSSDSNETARILNSPEAQRTKVREYASRGLLKKKYEYIFTGKNTEVINLDLKFEMAYFLISPIAGGQIEHDRVANNNAGNTQSVRERIRAVKSEIVANERARQILMETGDYTIANMLRTQTIDLLGNLTQERIAAPGGIQTRYQQAIVGNHNGYSSENDTVGAARLQHAAIIANLENGSDLLTIEMHIRGDPYWLGKPNNYNSGGTTSSTSSLANYDIGGNMFFLKANIPVQENSDGRRIPQRDNVITGLYRVINVINQFRNGQFTQYLKAVRENTIESANIPENLNVPEAPLNPGRGNIVEGPNSRRDTITGATTNTGSPSTVDPQIPSNASVAEAATQTGVIPLDSTNLIGVFGTADNRRALIRLPDGGYQNNVVVGTELLGSRVSSITENTLTLENGDILTIPGGE